MLGKHTFFKRYERTGTRGKDMARSIKTLAQGEILMGDDITQRTVLSVEKKTGVLYQINQTKGMSYVIDEDHILALCRYKNGMYEFLNVPFGEIKKKIQRTSYGLVHVKDEWFGYKVKATSTLTWKSRQTLTRGVVHLDRISSLSFNEIGEESCYDVKIVENGKLLLRDSTVIIL
jgi:hypothetical protein